MSTIADAPNNLRALLPDEGRALLRNGGLGSSWENAIKQFPPKLLEVTGNNPALQQLRRMRDFWAHRGDLQPALAATREIWAFRQRHQGPSATFTLLEQATLGTLVRRAGKKEEGKQLLEAAWREAKASTSRDLAVASVAMQFALALAEHGEFAAARPVLVSAHKMFPTNNMGRIDAAARLGEIELRLAHPERAVPLLEEALKLIMGAKIPHPQTNSISRSLGVAYNQAGRPLQAVATLRPLLKRLPQQDQERRAAVGFELGLALCRANELEEGHRTVDDALRLTRSLSAVHPRLPERLALWSELQLSRGRMEEAEGLLLEALEIERRLHGDASKQVALRTSAVARFLLRLGRTAEATGWLEPAASLMRSTHGDEHPRTRKTVAAFVDLLTQQVTEAARRKDPETAKALLSHCLHVATEVFGPTDTRVKKLISMESDLGLR